MSEADSLDRDLPESITQKGALPEPLGVSSATEGWHTVDCPGAISIDSIPRASSEPDFNGPDSTAPDAATELAQLRQENAELSDRATQLEQDFTQGQIEWQLETARLLHQVAESTPPEQAQAVQSQLTTAQERLSRVFQELELSHQTAQRQQILVETLTEQLESGQERIAELERDCAMTQQRYNEEVQQRLQAEATCRDLRIRLNRQQQHTLQFKVALEKCLEMPGGRSMPELDLNNTFSSGDFTSAEPIVVANSPVQPWSAPVNQLNLKPTLSHLLQDNLAGSMELMLPKPSIAPPSERLTPELTSQDAGDLVNQIFPGSEPPVAASSNDPSNSIFDIQPLLEDSGGIDPPVATQLQQASDTLWQDLTALIDAPTSGAEAERKAVSESRTTTPEASEPANLQNTLQVLGLGTSGADPQSSATRPLNTPLFSGSPSPVVYPLRPTKKRESLAAVELPTFPRKSQ